MDSQDKRKPAPLSTSFAFAINGIKSAIMTERNMRIHLAASCFVIGVSWYFSITKTEWLVILYAVGGMFALELVNTAIERVVDLVTESYHPLAKQAKDIAAGAAFIYAVLSVIVGMVIFLPYLLKRF